MEKVYIFKASFKNRKGLWRRIEIKGNQTLAVFDRILRRAFNHDLFDHLSEFYPSTFKRVEGFGEIDPDGGGSGAEWRIDELGIPIGATLRYVYDFGDYIEHFITLEKIVEPEARAEYPRVIAANKPRYSYCESCKKRGKKTIANWICIECSNNEQRAVVVCEDCVSKEHEDHSADEILY